MTTQTVNLITALAETRHRTLTSAQDALAEIGKLIAADRQTAPVRPVAAVNPCPSCGASRSAPAGTCPACGRNPAANKTGGKLTRAAFTALSPAARSRHIKAGGTLIS